MRHTFDVMMYFLMSLHTFDFMKYFGSNDVLFVVMTHFLTLIHFGFFMTYVLTSWYTFHNFPYYLMLGLNSWWNDVPNLWNAIHVSPKLNCSKNLEWTFSRLAKSPKIEVYAHTNDGFVILGIPWILVLSELELIITIGGLILSKQNANTPT